MDGEKATKISMKIQYHRSVRLGPKHILTAMKPIKSHPAFTRAEKFAAMISMVLALTCGAYGQSEPTVPFDLEKFQPVLSECRLHSPRTSGKIAVKRGRFGGYELPARFHLGKDGTTMVLATTNRGRDRSELRHNSSWSLLGEEKRLSARLRFDKPVPLEGKSRLHVVQIYITGQTKGPMVLVTWKPSYQGKEDHIWGYVRDSTTHDLGPRPGGFFNLDVSVKGGTVRMYMNGELKVEDDVSKFESSNAYFKTGSYHRGIEPQAVEFESLSITAK